MTILETFIKLRDDIKTWVANNLRQKADISYVDEKFDSIAEFDPTEIQKAIDANTAAIDTKYTKPETGIPESDFSVGVQNSLVLANTAIQEHQDISGKLDATAQAADSAKLNGEYAEYYLDYDNFTNTPTIPSVEGLATELQITKLQSDIDTKVDKVEGKGLSTNDYTAAEKDKLLTVEANANFYQHPIHDSYSSGLYKVTVDESGHVSGATLVEKEDIVALGIPAQDTTYEDEISDLSDRIDDVENSINTTNETLEGVSQEFESYKTTNNEAVSANAAAIEKLNGDEYTEGSVKQSINAAFNEFAANITNNEVVDTYKELIDYAADHAPEFAGLVAEVGGINTRVGEIETDISSYKTAVSDQFTEVDTTINTMQEVLAEKANSQHVHEIGEINSLQDSLDGLQTDIDAKADFEHEHNNLYYTKDEILESITVDDIDDICGSNVIIGGGDSNVVSYATKQWVQDGYQPKGDYLTSVPDGYATESYVNTQIASIPTPNVSGQINIHNISTDSHNDIRLIINGLSTRLNTLADCDDDTLDQMSEVVDYIKNNKSLIEGITTKKVNVSDIIDNLTTNVSNKPLSAAQGVILNGLIEELASNLSNYQPKGDYLTAVPDGYATEEFVITKIAEAELSEGITKEELKDVIDEYFEENPVSSSNNSLFASDDDNGNVTLTVVGFSVSDDDSGNITIS